MNYFEIISICVLLYSLALGIASAKTKTGGNGQNYVSKTKANWVYQHYPRVGSLFIKTGDGRTLHPGTLNCGKNRLTLNEFKQDLTLSFPSARSNFSYTFVIYENENKYLVRGIGNIKGEDLYEGRLTGYEVAAKYFVAYYKSGRPSADYIRIIMLEFNSWTIDDSKKLLDMEESSTEQIFFVEILEQAADKRVPESTYDRNEWSAIRTGWQDDVMSGSAGKTCFIIVPDNRQAPSVDGFTDIALLFQQFLAPSDAITTS